MSWTDCVAISDVDITVTSNELDKFSVPLRDPLRTDEFFFMLDTHSEKMTRAYARKVLGKVMKSGNCSTCIAFTHFSLTKKNAYHGNVWCSGDKGHTQINSCMLDLPKSGNIEFKNKKKGVHLSFKLYTLKWLAHPTTQENIHIQN